jgi:hypothetical protein
LGFGDGLTSRPHSHSQHSLVQGGDGRLWIATETGSLSMDPRRIARTRLPPGVAIRSVTAGEHLYRDPAVLQLKASTSSVEIDFAVLSFAAPKQVSVRYRLEGFDQAWIDPGARRQAFYTNLKPGRYRFQVIAANNEGVWNRAGASVDFEIPPTFLQSRGFLALCTGLTMLLLWLLYRLRVAQIAQRIRDGLEAGWASASASRANCTTRCCRACRAWCCVSNRSPTRCRLGTGLEISWRPRSSAPTT